MQLFPGITAERTAAYIEPIKTLVLSDLHLGYEEELRRKGVYIPTGEFARIEKLLDHLVSKFKPKIIVLNGDIKHSFGSINSHEWKHTKLILERLQTKSKVVLVQGNHDPVLAPVANAAGLTVEPYHIQGQYLFVHGDAIPETKLLKGITTIIMGHEHPAVNLHNGIRGEIYKCFLTMKYKTCDLLVLPSTFGLTQGADVLATEPRNPLLKNLADANVFVVEEEQVLAFGSVKELRAMLPKPEADSRTTRTRRR